MVQEDFHFLLALDRSVFQSFHRVENAKAICLQRSISPSGPALLLRVRKLLLITTGRSHPQVSSVSVGLTVGQAIAGKFDLDSSKGKRLSLLISPEVNAISTIMWVFLGLLYRF